MMDLKYLTLTITIFACQAWTIHSCSREITNSSGVINGYYSTYTSNQKRECWRILVKQYHQINISIEMPEFVAERKKNCEFASIQITFSEGGNSRFCDFEKKEKDLLSFFPAGDSYVDVYFNVDSREYQNFVEFKFTLDFFIESTIFGDIDRFNDAHISSIGWLKRRHSPFWGWKEDTPRAVTALYLTGGAKFSGKVNEEIMAKESELRTALALTWNTVSNQQLGTFINGLLTACHNPRKFYGHNLVSKLKIQVESTKKVVHPIVYLALCNANETWPDKAFSDLTKTLNKKTELLFVKDVKAFAVMSLACAYNRTYFFDEKNNGSLKSLYLETIKGLMEDQLNDGSFGTVSTTAFVSQALIASGEVLPRDLRMNATFHYLIKELIVAIESETEIDFLSVYATLPLLNGKTLADISHIDCTNHPRRKEDGDSGSEINDYQGPKIRVQYSLYLGDNKDVIHTISLRVPTNTTAYRLIELAGQQDKKYEIKMKNISNKKYVYEIAGIQNDPEEGKFWFLYKKMKDTATFTLSHITNPDEHILEDEDYLIMWYKTMQI